MLGCFAYIGDEQGEKSVRVGHSKEVTQQEIWSWTLNLYISYLALLRVSSGFLSSGLATETYLHQWNQKYE